MKLMNYKAMLSSPRADIEASKIPFRVKEMQKRAELELCQYEALVAELEKEVNELSSRYPLDFVTLFEAMDELDFNTRRLEQLQELIKDLFEE